MSTNRLQAPYRAATYVLSAHRPVDFPPDAGFEVAFAGRSNSGKSSAINALTGQNALARTSKTPGRTQQIVFFRIDDERRLVDLPGYGYAKVPEAVREHWRKLIERYLESRESLRGIVLLMDVRHPLRDFDRQMLTWCSWYGVPAHAVLTKADKLKKGPAKATLLAVRKELGEGGTAQLLSAKTREGVGELAARIAPWYGYAADEEDSLAGAPPDRIDPGTQGEHA